jgi:hypothetical protein
MSQTTFYAARADEIDVLRFVFDETDCHVYEAYSRPDHELRRFASLADVRKAFDVGGDRPGENRTILLSLWSPATCGEATVSRYDLEVRDARFRYQIGGWGLFRLQLGGSGDGVIGDSWFAHNSEKRAHKWGRDAYTELAPPDAWDWEAVTKLGRRVIYHIRNRLAVAKAGSAAVLATANELRRAGWTLR